MAFIPAKKDGSEAAVETANKSEVVDNIEAAAVDKAKEVEEKLEENTEERLNKTFETGEPLDDPAESTSKPEDSTPEEKEEPAEDTGDEDDPTPEEKVAEAKLESEEKESKDGDIEAKDEDAEKGDVQKDTPRLSDAYFRAAIHRGFSEQEIKDFYETNPKLAERTFANIYEAVNRSSREFADIGRARKQMVSDTTPAPKAKDTATEAQQDEGFKGLDIEQLRKDNPDDPLIDMIAAQQTQNEMLYDEVKTLKSTEPAPVSGQPSGRTTEQQRAFNQEGAAIDQQIGAFFQADDLKSYNEFYGSLSKDAVNWDALTPGEKANRWAVIEMADEMIIGAEHFGREMKIDEAMRLAHLNVSEPLRERIIREDIKSKVVKRSEGISLKPSSTAKPATSAPTNVQELEEVTKTRLDKVFH